MFDIVRRKSLIDDLHDDSDNGPAICFSNTEIRKMFRLAGANRHDVLFDFGSGWGQLLVVALTEFDVKRAVGIERIAGRYKRSRERLEKWSAKRKDITPDSWRIVPTNFERVLRGKEKRANLEEATIVFYGLETEKRVLDKITKAWKGLPGNRRLVYYFNCLFPEIMPDAHGVDYPFCVSTFPFKPPKNIEAWLTRITGKTKSSLAKKMRPGEDELWDELRHDYRICSSAAVDETISEYKRRLKRAVTRSQLDRSDSAETD